jgi:CBS domain-containing protein
MQTVKDILHSKGHDIWSISPYATVFEALKLMCQKDIGALVVVDGGRTVGIISERDYARKIVLQGKVSRDTAVKDAMTSKFYSIKPDDTAEQCVRLMVAKDIRHILVHDGEKLVGILSIKDLAKTLIPGGENWASPSLLDT